MFHRVTYEQWTTIVPLIAFFLTFAVFVYIVWKAVNMEKGKRDQMASLPLDENAKPSDARDGNRDGADRAPETLWANPALWTTLALLILITLFSLGH